MEIQLFALMALLLEGAHWWKDYNFWLVVVGTLTGAAVSWQSWETRKSAEATRTQSEISRKAFISQFRPKIHVNDMWLNHKDGSLELEIWITNMGDTTAYLKRSNITVAWKVIGGPNGQIVATDKFEPAELQPGGECRRLISLNHIAGTFDAARKEVEDYERRQRNRFHCYGYLSYEDENGTKRITGFYRYYRFARRRFLPSKDHTKEFAY